MATLHKPDRRSLLVWTRTRGSEPGPAGEGGSRLCNVSEVVISFHPSSWMGTRSHSLTRHKDECVCVRVEGFKGGGLMGSRP